MASQGELAAALPQKFRSSSPARERAEDPHFHSDYELLGAYNVVPSLLLRYPRIITSDERVLSLSPSLPLSLSLSLSLSSRAVSDFFTGFLRFYREPRGKSQDISTLRIPL
jgi:hypothetical protein